MNRTPRIVVDKPTRDRLRKAYEEAKAAGEDVFTFEGQEVLVAYAKYLLEFLDNLLGPT